MFGLKGLVLKTWRIGTCILSKEGRQTPTQHQSSDRNITNITQMRLSINFSRPLVTSHSRVTKHRQRDCKQEDKNYEKIQNNLVMIK